MTLNGTPPSRPGNEADASYIARLQHFTAAVSSAVRMRDVAQVLFERELEQFGARAIGIVWAMGHGRMELVFGRGVSTEEFEMLDAAARAGEALPIRDAVVGRRSIWLETPEAVRERYPVLEDLRARRGESGFAVVPLVVGTRCPGVIGLTFGRASPLSDAERGFIETIAQVSAQAFERARLFEAEQAARLEAERVGELQQQLMAIVGHDLRTPLSAILASAEYLERRGALGLEQARVVRRIASSAARMSGIIGDLVDFGRVRRGLGLSIQRQRADVAEIVRGALAEFGEPELGRASLETRGDTSLECDPGRIAQVVSNLIGNGLRHGRSAVRVEVAGGPSDVVLSVHNDGASIPGDLLPHVFEPFRQGADPGSPVGRTGLGLFIVREIVSAHGGSVDVASDDASGTTFTVRIPR